MLATSTSETYTSTANIWGYTYAKSYECILILSKVDPSILISAFLVLATSLFSFIFAVYFLEYTGVTMEQTSCNRNR